MTAAGWTLALLGAFLMLAGAGMKRGNAPTLQAVAEEIARLPRTLRVAVEAESGSYMLLGLGLVLLLAALGVFLLGSVVA